MKLNDYSFANIMFKHFIWCNTDNYGVRNFGIDN